MFNKAMGFLNSNNILYKHQYGFRAKKYSTIHSILHLINQCTEADQKTPKEHTFSIFCDLSKAFDVIDHKIIFKKCTFMALGESSTTGLRIILLVEDNMWKLKNRGRTYIRQRGVPQGSILGPLLYLIYVNDIAMSTTANILSFADDTSLFLSNSDARELYISANSAIKSLYEWLCANKLALNDSKTKYTILRAPHTR